MKTKHTKGEWTIGENGRSYKLIAKNNGLICPYIYGESGESAEANAKLIAAAPELLEALVLLLEGSKAPDFKKAFAINAINKATK